MEMVTIPKKEYERLKKTVDDAQFVKHLDRSIADAKAGRVTRVV